MKINGLILAAGESSRLGQPKQLILHQGQSLLSLTEQKVASVVNQTFTVLGFEFDTFVKELNHSKPIENNNWKQGMGTSLRTGLHQASVGADGVLIALCDQPLIDSEHFKSLQSTAIKHPDKIIASQYNKINGVPVIIPKIFFPTLLYNNDPQGAKKLIKNNPNQVIPIACESAAYDIDVPADMSWLN